MTTLRFGVRATIAQLRYDGGIAAARIESAVGPALGCARLVMPRELREEGSPADRVSVELLGEDGEFVEVFAGVLHGVSRSTMATTVTATDSSGALALARPGSSYDQRSAKAVITAIAQDVGVPTGVIDLDVPLAGYVADQRRTAWEHITRIAAWGGAIATVDAEGKLAVRRRPVPPAGRALRYGREIAALRVQIRARRASHAVVPVGFGPASSAEAPNVRQQTTATIPGNPPSPADDAVRLAVPALRTPAALAAATAAVRALPTDRMSADCWLLPDLRAGATVEIADAPDESAAGPWLVTRAVHEVGPGPRGRTRFEATPLASAEAGLLGAAISAVGSLL